MTNESSLLSADGPLQQPDVGSGWGDKSRDTPRQAPLDRAGR